MIANPDSAIFVSAVSLMGSLAQEQYRQALRTKHWVPKADQFAWQVDPAQGPQLATQQGLTQACLHPYSEDMEVHFSPEQEARLTRVAAHAGMDTELFVKDAALRRVEERSRFSTAVSEGIAQADRGELIDDYEIRIWLEQQERS